MTAPDATVRDALLNKLTISMGRKAAESLINSMLTPGMGEGEFYAAWAGRRLEKAQAQVQKFSKHLDRVKTDYAERFALQEQRWFGRIEYINGQLEKHGLELHTDWSGEYAVKPIEPTGGP